MCWGTLGWRDLEGWLLEQLPEDGPEVVLVGALEGGAGELAQRLQQDRPQWPLVASPPALPPQAEAIQLPVLPGWDRQDLRILASSSGLHADGWLETTSRLVIQLLGEGEGPGGLRLGLYLPEEGLLAGDPAVLIQLSSTGEAITQVLRPGLNAVVVPYSASPAQRVVMFILRVEASVQPTNASDQRRLMAVLVDLERCPAKAYSVVGAVNESDAGRLPSVRAGGNYACRKQQSSSAEIIGRLCWFSSLQSTD